jgi:prepilin-type processing-associated H-X9-DG protein
MEKAKGYGVHRQGNTSYWTPMEVDANTDRSWTPKTLTFLAYDFLPGAKDAGTYPSGVGRTPAYGPSSGHPGVVNHLFCDGSVRSLRKDIDYAEYFFAITRDGGSNEPRITDQ